MELSIPPKLSADPQPLVVEVGFLPSAFCLVRRLPLRVADQQWCTVDSLSRRHNLHHQDPAGRELNLPPAVAAAAHLWPADRFDGDHVLSRFERTGHIHGNHVDANVYLHVHLEMGQSFSVHPDCGRAGSSQVQRGHGRDREH